MQDPFGKCLFGFLTEVSISPPQFQYWEVVLQVFKTVVGKLHESEMIFWCGKFQVALHFLKEVEPRYCAVHPQVRELLHVVPEVHHPFSPVPDTVTLLLKLLALTLKPLDHINLFEPHEHENEAHEVQQRWD